MRLNTIEILQHGPLKTFDLVSCFLLLVNILKEDKKIEVDALLNFGAIASFIDVDFVEKNKLPLKL